MELKRRLPNWMLILPFITENISTALPLSEKNPASNLDCTNDFTSLMSCQFEAQNCSEYSLTLISNDGYGESQCILSTQSCDSGLCCCSVQMENQLIPKATHEATVWKDGERILSKTISITESIKPKKPTIISVDEVNGNFEVKWETNSNNYLSDSLTAYGEYYKKTDTGKVFQFERPAYTDIENVYEIPGRDLEPSTTYVVSVKSYTDLSNRSSDSSREWEFTTPASRHTLFLAGIAGLSFAAVIITSAAFCCYSHSKAKWWDTVAKCPHPKLLNVHPGEQKFLEPLPTSFSNISIDSTVLANSKPCSGGSLTDTSSGNLLQSSGISAGSSCQGSADTEPADIKACVKDALSKTFAQLRPELSVTTNLLGESGNPSSLRADASHGSPGPTVFDNMTYFNSISSSSDVQTQAEMVCESAYHLSDTVTCPDQQGPACPPLNFPPVASSLMPTEMSFQQRSADSGRFSYAEDSSLSSISSSTNTTASCDPVSRVEAGCESFYEEVSGAAKLNGEREEATVCDENPCYGCAPTASHSFAPVDDDYQAFQNLVERPGVLLSEQTSGEKEKYPVDSFTKIIY